MLRDAVPRRRCRHHRRQLPDRRDRHQRHRHQRGQRRPDADAAARAHRARQHREDGADAGGRDDAAARAGALGDRAGVLGLHHVLHRRAAAGRPRRAGGIPRRAARQRPLRACSAREFQDMLRCIRCAACMNHCPVYRRGRRPCLWLGLSRADGRGADAGADRRRQGRAPAQRLDLLRQLRERLPGEDPAAEADAPLARARVRAASDAGGVRGGPGAVGVRSPGGRRCTGWRRGAAACGAGLAGPPARALPPAAASPAAGPRAATCRRRRATPSSPATPASSARGAVR